MNEVALANPDYEATGYLKRGKTFPVLFSLSLLPLGLSMLSGGIVELTDAGFGYLVVLLVLYLFNELRVFGIRYGIGGLVFAFGSLIFFCHDYFFHWSGILGAGSWEGRGNTTFDPDLLARACFFHALFITAMSIGLLVPWGQKIVNVFRSVPEPTSRNYYLAVVIILTLLGLIPYLFFTREPFYLAIYHDIVGARNFSAEWTVGRTGNLNTSWGAYLANLIDLGEFGGIVAIVYAILVARSPLAKAFGVAIWLFWCARVFGTGSRSFLLVLLMPAVVVLFIKYHAQAAAFYKKNSVKAYVVCGLLMLVTLFVIKYQINNRNQGYTLQTLADTNPFKIEGNGMYSATLPGFVIIPDEEPFFMNRFPGEALVRPITEWVMYFVIHPIPRAMWEAKPVDPLWEWYNYAHARVYFNTHKRQATISQGAVGYWYMRYGWMGVLQGGIFVGFLMRLFERVIQQADGKPLTILIALGFEAKLFNGYRGLLPAIIYEIVFGFMMLWLLMQLQRLMQPGPEWHRRTEPAA